MPIFIENQSSTVGAAGATGPQGAQGIQGATGTFNPIISTPTVTWFGSSGADVRSFLTTAHTTSTSATAPALYYTLNPDTVTDINVTVLASNGYGASGMFKQDFNNTYGCTGANVAIPLSTTVTTNQRGTLGTSGFNGAFGVTGPNVYVVVSTPTAPLAGYTGAVSWSILAQINELLGP